MARGIGERQPDNTINFWELPEKVQQAAEDAAVRADKTAHDWWDLEPAVRRRVRDQAVMDWLRGRR